MHDSLQDFGGDSEKGTWLYSNYNVLEDLDLFKSGPGKDFGKRPLTRQYYNSKGKKKFHGTKNLKASEHYPKPFGVAVKNVFLKNRDKIRTCMSKLRLASLRCSSSSLDRDRWPDADLSSVAAFLVKG